MIRELKNVKARVREILRDHPETQDDDRLLWLGYSVIYDDLRNYLKIYPNLNSTLPTDAYQIFKHWVLDKSTSAESLRRARQLVQAENPDLRGKKYAQRHKEAQKVKEFV